MYRVYARPQPIMRFVWEPFDVEGQERWTLVVHRSDGSSARFACLDVLDDSGTVLRQGVWHMYPFFLSDG